MLYYCAFFIMAEWNGIIFFTPNSELKTPNCYFANPVFLAASDTAAATEVTTLLSKMLGIM